MKKPLITKTKRGDTIIEVMFAFAVFSLVAILSVAMMNAGVATSERSLELVVARNELNAQAEALRFIHSSYISELTLPPCDSSNMNSLVQNGGKCQQYYELWDRITRNAVNASSIPLEISACQKIYESTASGSLLYSNNAFVINIRSLNVESGAWNVANKVDDIYKSAKTNLNIFQPAPLGARLVYSTRGGGKEEDYGSSIQQSGYNPVNYTNLIRAEGIWVVAIDGGNYYDFRIQTCWYGSGNIAPTTLDTVIRLNKPE